jgi:carbon-monoxide dehydrogenase medium subunit
MNIRADWHTQDTTWPAFLNPVARRADHSHLQESTLKPIDYVCPKTLDEAIGLLSEEGKVSRPFAGGTDLIIQLRTCALEADRVVDIKRIPELNEITFDEKGLSIGAAVPCSRICENVEIAGSYPGLFDALSLIGGVQIRNRASLGGNLCNASPAADGIPPLMVHRAVCEIAHTEGFRQVPVKKFCLGPGKTVLERGELLVSILIPPVRGKSGSQYQRFTPRNEMDIAVAGAASFIELEDDGATIRNAGIGLASVAPVPLYLEEGSRALKGKKAGDEAFAAAAEQASLASRPIEDMRGEAWQRRHLAGLLTRRTLQGAFERAIQGSLNS